MNDTRGSIPTTIAMLGSFPPLRALSSYCSEIASAVSYHCKVEFISFRKIYPVFLYPGGDLDDDHTFPIKENSNIKVSRRLTWYNPLTWFIEGLFRGGQLLHAQWWSLPLALIYLMVCLLYRLRKRPVIFTVHNVKPHERTPVYSLISGILFTLGNHFIVHSEINRRQLIKQYSIDPKQVTKIPHGPLGFQIQAQTDRERSREELGFNAENRVILLFGAIRPYKGLETALLAFAEIIKEIPEARLLIAGKLWEEWRPYQKIINRLDIGDHVSLHLRYIPSAEVCRYFLASDLVILPYRNFDSQSGAGATAISFHKPLIVSDVGGLPDLVVERDFIVPPGNPSALAKAIAGCLDNADALKQMSSGSERVAARMTWSGIAEKTWSIYKQVLNENAGHA